MNPDIKEEFALVKTTLWWVEFCNTIERRKAKVLADMAQSKSWEDTLRLQGRYAELSRIIAITDPTDGI